MKKSILALIVFAIIGIWSVGVDISIIINDFVGCATTDELQAEGTAKSICESIYENLTTEILIRFMN